MSVKKSTCDIYDVSNDGERASMALRAWHNEDGGRTTYGGEILIHSSYGTFCNIWTNSGTPFKEFLLKMTPETFLLKTLGAQSRVYCPEATVLKFNAHIGQLYSEGRLTNEQAELVLQTFEVERQDLEPTHDAFAELMTSLEEHDAILAAIPADDRELLFAEASMLKGWRPNPYGMSFWNELWPELVAALRNEVQAEAAQAEVAHAG